MTDNLTNILKSEPIQASAPCRIDMGGTLDIRTFHYPLAHLSPCTFNIAVALRTQVRLFPYDKGMVKISSRGFESAAYPLDTAPFNHPLGLMFAIAAYFRADGVHIDIASSSPPRSALGGSSSAAVALVAAFSKAFEQTGATPLSRETIAELAHVIEESVAGVPCGRQDQLAAVFGGVNAWHWQARVQGPVFKQKRILDKPCFEDLERRLLLAYCGIPHESKNINGKWVQQFLSGRHRDLWAEIVGCARTFSDALAQQNLGDAIAAMNRETAIRRKMTPDVLDKIGEQLVGSAVENNCAARFTGAGGGGCIWALGEAKDIGHIRQIWENILLKRKDARLLDMKTDSQGLIVS